MPERSREGFRYDRETDTAQLLSGALGWSFVDLEEYSISCGLLRKVAAELACRHRFVPMVHNSHRTVVVVDDPFEGYYLAQHPELFGSPRNRRVEIALTTRRGLDLALHKRITIVND